MLSLFRGRRWAVIAATSIVTVTLGVGVVLAITPVGCKLAGSCPSKLAAATSPSPLEGSGLGPQVTPPGSTVPPNVQPATPSEPAPTRNPAYPAYEYPASSGLPPLYPDASASGWSPAGLLSCRLPIYAGGPGSGGFISFPDGSFVADPRSAVTLPAGAPTPAPQGGPGYGPGTVFLGLSYDKAYAKWLPVGYDFVTPDGLRYAYAGQDGIYVVKVADSTVSEIGEGHAWTLVDVESAGVYAHGVNAAGLWWIPFSGSGQLITTTGFWQSVGGGAAYGTATSAVPQGVPNTILRLDLKTGAMESWFLADGASSQVAGFDSKGVLLVQTSSFNGDYTGNYVQLWSVPSVGGAKVIVDTFAFKATNFGPPIISDSHGLWSSNGQAIFVLVQGDGLHRAAGVGGQLAGGCG